MTLIALLFPREFLVIYLYILWTCLLIRKKHSTLLIVVEYSLNQFERI